jgi:hypothetical protein
MNYWQGKNLKIQLIMHFKIVKIKMLIIEIYRRTAFQADNPFGVY